MARAHADGATGGGVSGPGVCSITATTAAGAVPGPSRTYDGTYGSIGTAGGDIACTGIGCGRPNIFQGRTAASVASGVSSSIVFAGVPFDPPGTLTTRFLRITNVRADAELLGATSSFVTTNVTMSISITGSQSVTVTNFTAQQTVATILNGLTVTSDGKGDTSFSNTTFLQCNSENSKLFAGTATTGNNVPGGGGYTVQPGVQFVEGFQNAWKTKNIAFMTTGTTTPGSTTIGNGSFTTSGAVYGGTINYPNDVAQNVPGVNYNTESGFEWIGTGSAQGLGASQPVLTVNPPTGVSPTSVTSAGFSLWSGNGFQTGGTGIQSAGQATQGTRLAMSFTNIPNGLSIFLNPVVILTNGTNTTGVMVLTSTAADGSGAFSTPTGATVAGASSSCIAGVCTANPKAGRTSAPILWCRFRTASRFTKSCSLIRIAWRPPTFRWWLPTPRL